MDVDVVIAECGKITDALNIAINACIDLHGVTDLNLLWGSIGYVAVINKLVAVVLVS